MVVGRGVNPWLRRASAGWSPGQAALASFGTFVLGVVIATAIAAAAATFCDALLKQEVQPGAFGDKTPWTASVKWEEIKDKKSYRLVEPSPEEVAALYAAKPE